MGLVLLLSLVYLILVSLAVLGVGVRLVFTTEATKLFNKEEVKERLYIGFYVGELSTALLQSSSVRKCC